MSYPNNTIDNRFKVGALYLGLWARDTPEATYHWGLYHHRDSASGYKYHIKNGAPGFWVTDHGKSSRCMKSIALIGFMRIGHCIANDIAKLDKVFGGMPLNRIPPGYPALTCKTWTLHAVALLEAAGFVMCSDLEALYAEILKWGSSEYEPTMLNVQPRTIIDSQSCVLA
ncbi:hypothetical protein CONPUDRAFT_124512 [Coniophora puteana RWD-64-598 SS2]|uniref:Uncharacterized protein n=1 Tax=Coniophora puteana (strain RWD-64-598) TaxID=741705 RepID=A0A5M3MQE5_CONPW|nr:uncharacterized protein CONPUDRAFT_124512 [Coniophora puteana RWD-64-598 SS2]EIW81393.1 hypothetical protein CONPUDRAFT_124512 [Coniophora puteana RWD-64-598 SS2]